MTSEDVAKGLSCLRMGSFATATGGEDENEDDNSDEEDEPSVIIGFLQKPQHPWSLSRHLFPSKAGGTPAWLDPINIPQGDDILCGICGKPMQFLLQVYAAIEGREHAFHRTLFVFMCPNMACLHKDRENQINASQEKLCRSVKVFRCQLCRINEFYSKDPSKNNGLDSPISKGVPLCSWCGTWKGEKICGGCKKVRYCSRQHQLEHWKSSHSAACKAQVAYTGEPSENLEGKIVDLTSTQQQVDANLPACTKLWPEYEILDEEEGSDEESTSSGNMAIIGNGKEDDISRQFQEIQPSLEQQHWAGFQARLARAPGQVLRYCRSHDAKPLWPRLDERPSTLSIPVCHLCNGRRIFEFQILPQLLYFFKVPNDPDGLDWGTLAVYTCDASCTSSKAYMEEFVWVQSA